LNFIEKPDFFFEKYKKIQNEKGLGNIEEQETEESIETPRFTF